MAKQVPATWTSYELAIIARDRLIANERVVKVVVDGEVVEYTPITLPQLNDTILGMRAYLDIHDPKESPIVAYNFYGTKGF